MTHFRSQAQRAAVGEGGKLASGGRGRSPTCAGRGAAAPPADAAPPPRAAAARRPGAVRSPPKARIPRRNPAQQRPVGSRSGPGRPAPEEKATRRCFQEAQGRTSYKGPEMCCCEMETHGPPAQAGAWMGSLQGLPFSLLKFPSLGVGQIRPLEFDKTAEPRMGLASE